MRSTGCPSEAFGFFRLKTIAPSHPSPHYGETRAFYASVGYSPLERFPLLWRPEHPALQLVKALEAMR